MHCTRGWRAQEGQEPDVGRGLASVRGRSGQICGPRSSMNRDQEPGETRATLATENEELIGVTHSECTRSAPSNETQFAATNKSNQTSEEQDNGVGWWWTLGGCWVEFRGFSQERSTRTVDLAPQSAHSEMRIHRSDGKLINGAGTNESPSMPRVNRTVIGTSGVSGMPAMTGIGGHLGPPVVMMKCGLRGHHGHNLVRMIRKSTSTRARFQSGTEVSQRRPGVIALAS